MRIIGSHLALALAALLGLALVAVAVIVVVLSSNPYSGLDGSWVALAATFLVLPLLLVLASIAWNRHRTTEGRAFVTAGVAALVPPVGALTVGSALGQPSTAAIAALILGALLLPPSTYCFSASAAVRRGDPTAALKQSRLVAPWILAPATLAVVFSTPLALSAIQPCELCIQAAIGLLGLVAYAAPALVAGFLAASAHLRLRRLSLSLENNSFT